MNRLKNFLVLAVISLFVGACGPPMLENWVEVGNEETAFVIPLEGDSLDGQKKFDSIDFLEEKKVSSKRIILPLRKKATGRFDSWQFIWVPTAKVVKVKRSPVTREWTGGDNGTSPGVDQGIHVESLDSVGFTVGANTTAHIEEHHTARFLYSYPGDNLAEVIDTNVRGLATEYLSSHFGTLPLDGEVSCKTEKKKISEGCHEYLKNFFIEKGITIDSFGLVGGLLFDDPEIQSSITDQVKSAQDLIVAQNERRSQLERNQRDQEIADRDAYVKQKLAEGEGNAEIALAQAKAEAASILWNAREAILLELEVFERKKAAEAKLAAGSNLPNAILPAGSPLLMGLDTK